MWWAQKEMKIRLCRGSSSCRKGKWKKYENSGELNLHVMKGHFVMEFHLTMLKHTFHCSFPQSQQEKKISKIHTKYNCFLKAYKHLNEKQPQKRSLPSFH